MTYDSPPVGRRPAVASPWPHLLEVLPPQVVLQEVPGEVSLALTVLGCPYRCIGCHSPETWHLGGGLLLTPERLNHWLDQYRALLTCLCLFGGDWQPRPLLAVLKQARNHKLKTCLYAGAEQVDQRLLGHLDYLKLGPYQRHRGGLDSATTNQRFYRLPDWTLLNHCFQSKTDLNPQPSTNHGSHQ